MHDDLNFEEKQGNEYTFNITVFDKNDKYQLDLEPEYNLSDLYDSISEVTQIDKLTIHLVFETKRIPNDPNITLTDYFGLSKEVKEIGCFKENINGPLPPIQFIVRAYQIDEIYNFVLNNFLQDLYNKITELTKIDPFKKRLSLVYDNRILNKDDADFLVEIFGQPTEQIEIGCFFENWSQESLFSFKVRVYQTNQTYEFTIPEVFKLYDIEKKIIELTNIDETQKCLCLVYANKMFRREDYETELGEIFGTTAEQKEIGCFFEQK